MVSTVLNLLFTIARDADKYVLVIARDGGYVCGRYIVIPREYVVLVRKPSEVLQKLLVAEALRLPLLVATPEASASLGRVANMATPIYDVLCINRCLHSNLVNACVGSAVLLSPRQANSIFKNCQ